MFVKWFVVIWLELWCCIYVVLVLVYILIDIIYFWNIMYLMVCFFFLINGKWCWVFKWLCLYVFCKFVVWVLELVLRIYCILIVNWLLIWSSLLLSLLVCGVGDLESNMNKGYDIVLWRVVLWEGFLLGGLFFCFGWGVLIWLMDFSGCLIVCYLCGLWVVFLYL